MKRLICLMSIISSSLFSCSNAEKLKENKDKAATNIQRTYEKPSNEQMRNLDSIKQTIHKKSSRDTISYVFSLEGNFSAEGNEGKAFYENKAISSIQITFFGETGKAIYFYRFKKNKINVVQQRYNYHTNLTEVKSEKDMVKGDKVVFTTDLQGELISGADREADLDTFFELKKAVLFSLK